MNFIEIMTSVIAVISLLGTALVAFRSKVGNIQKTVIDAQSEELRLRKEQIDSLDRRVTVCEGLHRDALNKVGTLTGVVNTLEKVLENRDPQLEKTLGAILTFMEKIESYMSKK